MDSLLVYLIPVFVLFMVAEYAYGLKIGKSTYTFNDTAVNLTLGLMSSISQFVTKFFQIGIYILAYDMVWGAYENPFWHTWIGVAAGVLIFDFFDYWLHRAEHESAALWAAHVVHHQSPQYNFSVALRQVTTEPLLGFLFYLPMAFIGIPPEQLLLTALLVLFYQFFLHTDHVPKLGWLENVLNTPSNHRVHHAVNERYLDKNYGVVTMIWDRLFGTYQAETEPCRYGTVKPFTSNNPIWANAIEYVGIWRKATSSDGLWNKVRAVFSPPGWMPEGYVGASAADATVSMGDKQELPRLVIVAQFLVVAVLAGVLLSQEESLGYPIGTGIVVAIFALCGCLGALIDRKINALAALAVNLFALAVCAYLFQL